MKTRKGDMGLLCSEGGIAMKGNLEGQKQNTHFSWVFNTESNRDNGDKGRLANEDVHTDTDIATAKVQDFSALVRERPVNSPPRIQKKLAR